MSDVEDDELSELPSSDPFRTAEIQEVSDFCKHCIVCFIISIYEQVTRLELFHIRNVQGYIIYHILYHIDVFNKC